MRRISLLALSLSASAVLVRAEPVDPFRSDDVVDAIGVARVASEAGDEALRKALERPAVRDAALIAARAAPFAHAPERLVPSLVTLAVGRDPQLAPEAAQALLAISERLTLSELSTREVLRSELEQARAALNKVGEHPATRLDVAWALSQTASSLTAATAP